MNRITVKNLTLTGLFMALIFVFTALIHIPGYTGYIHIGDAFLFLAASILPTPYAICAGAIGAALADCLTGFVIWAPASLVIKGVTVLFFTWKETKILGKRNYLALIPSALLCAGGYYLYEGIIYGNLIVPLYGIPGNLLQAVLCSAAYVFVGLALDKAGLKTRLRLMQRAGR